VPGAYFLGILPAWERTIFDRGPVGIASRSGSLGTLVCVEMVRRGLGQSVFLGIGGDPIVGTSFGDALASFEADAQTRAVVLVGEIGGTMEEDAAPVVAGMSKPVVAFIAGASAPEGKKMGHAGAIVAGDRGTARSKQEALRAAGARVAEVPSQLGPMLADALR
jgi:succinyl-CoA synthetase alpha subunit